MRAAKLIKINYSDNHLINYLQAPDPNIRHLKKYFLVKALLKQYL